MDELAIKASNRTSSGMGRVSGRASVLLGVGDDTPYTLEFARAFSRHEQFHCGVVPVSVLPGLARQCGDAVFMLDCGTCRAEVIQKVLAEVEQCRSATRVALVNVGGLITAERFLSYACLYGLFFENSDMNSLVQGAAAMRDGKMWMPRDVMQLCIERGRSQRKSAALLANLTKREAQILHRTTLGETNREIADRLCLSEHTIKTHMHNIFKKINVKNRVQAANLVRQERLFEDLAWSN
jgi:LuxR family transcriptional regulator of csgAB operon